MVKRSKLDFIGIGAPICGTTWLYQNLRRHPSVWMSWIKEFHYFDSQREEGVASAWYKQHSKEFRRYVRAKLRSREFDLELLWWFKYLRGARSDRWYASLFEGRPGAVCGEITPRYAYLQTRVIRDMVRLFPDLKIVLLARDPIERTWSYATKMLAQQHGRHMSAVSEEETIDFVANHIPGGCEAWNDFMGMFDRWNRHFPAEQIFVGFHDHLASDPKQFFDSVCAFLGIPSLDAVQFQFLEGKVSTTDACRVPIPPEGEREIAARVVDGLKPLSAHFGGAASRWLARAEASLRTMQAAG